VAEAVTAVDQPSPKGSAQAPEQALVAPPPRPPGEAEAGHGHKFRLVYVLLAGIVAAAAGGLVVLLTQPGSEPKAPFSPWVPTSEASQDRAQEIANFVGGNYRLESGAQLVSVQAAPPRVQDIPVAAVAIRSVPGGASFSGENIPVFPAGETMVYILCGLGADCAIEEGTPSEERQRLLRREALELALYTFRYVDGMNYVVAFMPPRPGYRPSYALFFQRPDLDDLVDRPLRDTLPEPIPPLADEILPSEAALIDQLTQPRFFAFQFQQLQDGNAVLVLDNPADPRAPTPQPATPAPTEDGATTTDTGSTAETGG
jgi:hypothetical protein